MEKKSKKIVLSALFTAVIAVISQLSFYTPSGVPVTLQVFGVCLCGYILGAKWSVASVVTYVFAGAVGLPVFTFFRGGIHHIFSSTGGFILGFLILAFLCGLSNSSKTLSVILGLGGLILCHFIGVLQFSLVGGVGFFASFLAASLPFIAKDILLVVAAALIAPKLKKIVLK